MESIIRRYKWKFINNNYNTYNSKVYLNKDRNRESGAAAYDNAVQAIDAYCYKYFSNETAGVEARNIKIEDIEAHETNAGTSARTGYTKYNTLVTPINHAYYPSIYPQETDNNLGLSEYYPTTSKYAPNTTATHAVYNSTKYSSYKSTYYDFSNSNITNNNYYDTTTKDILFTSTGYGSGFWLASRCVNFDSSNAYFDVRYVGSYGNLDGYDMLYSNGNYGYGALAFRPVVSIPASKVANYTLS